MRALRDAGDPPRPPPNLRAPRKAASGKKTRKAARPAISSMSKQYKSAACFKQKGCCEKKARDKGEGSLRFSLQHPSQSRETCVSAAFPLSSAFIFSLNPFPFSCFPSQDVSASLPQCTFSSVFMLISISRLLQRDRQSEPDSSSSACHRVACLRFSFLSFFLLLFPGAAAYRQE